MYITVKLIFFAALSLALSSVGAGESPGMRCGDGDDRVGAVLNRYVETGRIAGVVSVLSDADYNETYDCCGWADIENGRPIRPDSVFSLFSMTKTFTGAAVMCAIDEGKMSLDDEVSKY